MSGFELITHQLVRPALVVHGGAGAYVRTTTQAQRLSRGQRLSSFAKIGLEAIEEGGARAGVLAAVAEMEKDETLNAGYGARLQQDGECRVSAALMDGRNTRLSAVYNLEGCLHPSILADHLQTRADRNLDGTGARILMDELDMARVDLRTSRNLERWKYLKESGEKGDSEGAIGDAGAEGAKKADEVGIAVPEDLKKDDSENRFGTVGAVAVDGEGELWACTSTGGRGHEHPGRVSDSPTPAGNYACPRVAISATGFGEQILDLNICLQ